jgi:hypothetical protein
LKPQALPGNGDSSCVAAKPAPATAIVFPTREPAPWRSSRWRPITCLSFHARVLRRMLCSTRRGCAIAAPRRIVRYRGYCKCCTELVKGWAAEKAANASPAVAALRVLQSIQFPDLQLCPRFCQDDIRIRTLSVFDHVSNPHEPQEHRAKQAACHAFRSAVREVGSARDTRSTRLTVRATVSCQHQHGPHAFCGRAGGIRGWFVRRRS